MLRILIALALAVGVSSFAGIRVAQAAPAACLPFSTFPLLINLGTGLNTGDGETVRCANQKIMASVNALNGARGQANGIATLGSDSRLSAAQFPSLLATLAVQGGLTAGSLSAQNSITAGSFATSGSFSASGIAAPNTIFAATPNPNAIVFAPGNQVSFCPTLSCISTPDTGHQRASLLVSAETQDDAHSEEQTVGITTTVSKGALKAYAASKSFTVGDSIVIGNAAYRATTSGTTGANSAPPSTRPTTAPFTTTDGTVTWLWINDGAIVAKVGLYNEVAVVPGGGNSWAQANNFHLRPGTVPSFNINTEFDFQNDSGTDCVPGAANCNNLYVTTAGANKSTTSLAIQSPNTANYAAIWGIRLNGDKLASDQDIAIDSGAAVGLGIGVTGFTPAFHATAAIQDGSTTPSTLVATGSKTVATINDVATSPTALSVTGTKSTADIYLGAAGPTAIRIVGNRTSAGITDASNSPASINITGAHTLAGIREASTSPIGLQLTGTYSSAQIVGTNFNVNASGDTNVRALGVSGNFYETNPLVPPSSTTACVAGQHAWDASYEYRCVAANTWKRAALTSW